MASRALALALFGLISMEYSNLGGVVNTLHWRGSSGVIQMPAKTNKSAI